MKWECSPFGPTNKCGIYAVMLGNSLTKESKVIYIGSSKNIFKRVMNPNHHYRKMYSHFEYPYFLFIKFKECEDFIEQEKKLIKRLRPEFNLQHTGKEFRSFKISLNG